MVFVLIGTISRSAKKAGQGLVPARGPWDGLAASLPRQVAASSRLYVKMTNYRLFPGVERLRQQAGTRELPAASRKKVVPRSARQGSHLGSLDVRTQGFVEPELIGLILILTCRASTS